MPPKRTHRSHELSISSSRLFQLFKYTVYALLAFNIVLFWRQESLAAPLQFANGVPIMDLIEAYAATIDTAAWVVLLLMFELETYVLKDRHYNATVTWSLHGARALCYVLIVYAAYGYVVNLSFINQVSAFPGINDICALVSDGWSYAVDLDEFTLLTAANCGTFSSADAFLRFSGMPAVVDAQGLTDIRYLAWVDVVNAIVWLLVVLILEVDVWLQERNRFEGVTLQLSNAAKIVLYTLLLLAAVYWGVKGDIVDFWDALLWLVAFIFIELNVFEWRQEIKQEMTLGNAQ
jgi:hypothetical protein